MDTLSGGNNSVCFIASLLNQGQLKRGKNLLPSEQILSFKSRPKFGRSVLSREANRKSQKSFPFMKMVEKYGIVPISGFEINSSK